MSSRWQRFARKWERIRWFTLEGKEDAYGPNGAVHHPGVSDPTHAERNGGESHSRFGGFGCCGVIHGVGSLQNLLTEDETELYSQIPLDRDVLHRINMWIHPASDDEE